MSWSQAHDAGLKTYFNGKPCIRGHVDIRYVSGRRCKTCGRDSSRMRARLKDRAVHAADVRAWWASHPEAKPIAAAKQKKWRQEHGEKYNQTIRKWHAAKIKSDPQYKLKLYLRTRIRSAVKSNARAGSAVKDLGCSITELKIQLEGQFLPSMTWDNHGPVWHIDHIKPLSRFDLTDRTQFLEACHYTNLQPLFALDNIRKGGVRRPK